jgi:bacteriocin biosynthesis cyclodehydratase domain-containing protein
MRPILRPGTHVLRRSPTELQVGLRQGQRLVLPDRPEVAADLDRLAAADPPPASAVLDQLGEEGLLMEASTLLPLIPGGTSDRLGVSRADVAALARTAGNGVGALLEARASHLVDVAPAGHPSAGALATRLGDLLDDAGLAVRDRSHRTRSRRRTEVAAMVVVGEPRRELVDGWMREGVAHLLVRFTEGSATVGPFVVPGQTACLRCLDAHDTDVDPAFPLVVEQYATASSRDRADGVPEPVDQLLAALTLAWAARDLATFVEGRRPSTWSSTVRLDRMLSPVQTRAWLRHAGCGCAWG